ARSTCSASASSSEPDLFVTNMKGRTGDSTVAMGLA
ncbi:MAG: hypothetical protein ACI88C_000512, partial [Acidimicrobiales bacterium]